MRKSDANTLPPASESATQSRAMRGPVSIVALIVWLVLTTGVHGQIGDVDRVHDPAIIKAGDHYYCFSTDTGIAIRRSKDLYTWERCGRVFPKNLEWFDRIKSGFRGHIWAPDISFHDGSYFLYYSISSFGKNRSAIGLAINSTLDPDHPNYRWEDKGIVIESRSGDNFNAIDANVVADGSGRRWMSFGSFWSGLKLFELGHDGKARQSPPRLHAIASRPATPPHAVEAPFITERGGYFYLFASFDQCCKGADSTYNTVVGRSKTVTGPYLDRDGKDMMDGGGTQILAGHGRWRGPGHNGIVKTETGYWIAHHAYDAENRGMRTLQIRPLIWARDGWPVAGFPIEQPPGEKIIPVYASPAGTWEHRVNFQASSELKLLANGRIAKPDSPDRWMVERGSLRMVWHSRYADEGVFIDELFLHPSGKWFVGRNQNGADIRGYRMNTIPRHSPR